MKRALPLLLCIFLLFGCSAKQSGSIYEHSLFTVSLPETFKPVKTDSMICFAPYGDPLLSSSITYYTTELNPYFDDFTDREYEEALQKTCGYESLSLVSVVSCKVDGNDTKRIACKVQIDQGTHDLIVYAVDGDRTYFFTLLNREGDPYIEAFDTMMQTIQFVKQ
jgi:hypothetical protein